MLNSLLQNRKAIEAQRLRSASEGAPPPSDVNKLDWHLIGVIKELLTPFAEAVEFVEGGKHPTISFVLPMVCVLTSAPCSPWSAC